MRIKTFILAVSALIVGLGSIPVPRALATEFVINDNQVIDVRYDENHLVMLQDADLFTRNFILLYDPYSTMRDYDMTYHRLIMIDSYSYPQSYIEEHIGEAFGTAKPDWALIRHYEREGSYMRTSFFRIWPNQDYLNLNRSRVFYYIFKITNRYEPYDEIYYWGKLEMRDCTYSYWNQDYTGICKYRQYTDEATQETYLKYMRHGDENNEHNEGYQEWSDELFEYHWAQMDTLSDQIDEWDGNDEEKEQILADLYHIIYMSQDTAEHQAEDTARAEELIARLQKKAAEGSTGEGETDQDSEGEDGDCDEFDTCTDPSGPDSNNSEGGSGETKDNEDDGSEGTEGDGDDALENTTGDSLGQNNARDDDNATNRDQDDTSSSSQTQTNQGELGNDGRGGGSTGGSWPHQSDLKSPNYGGITSTDAQLNAEGSESDKVLEVNNWQSSDESASNSADSGQNSAQMVAISLETAQNGQNDGSESGNAEGEAKNISTLDIEVPKLSGEESRNRQYWWILWIIFPLVAIIWVFWWVILLHRRRKTEEAAGN